MDAPAAATARASDSAKPLTAELSRLHVTVSRRFLEKLEAARAALSHGQLDASAASILEAGLDLILERHGGRRGLVEKPRAKSAAAASATAGIPASVKREVWKRMADGASGRSTRAAHASPRCGSNTTTSFRARWAAPRRPGTSGCSAGFTTTWRRGGPSARSG